MKKTDVLFVIEKDTEENGANAGQVLAVFPDVIEKTDCDGFKMVNYPACYAHIGQHSYCHPQYVKQCKEAEYYQYQDLLKELIGLGYKLNVLNSQETECRRKPTAGEIKFGHGATHYRTFTLASLITPKGELKKRFKAEDDGLIYSR